MIRLPTGELIGYVQATVTDRHAAIAYELASRYWGRGHASAAVTLMLHELAQHYGVETQSAVYKQRNWRSQQLLQRLGFEAASPEWRERLGAGADERAMVRTLPPSGGA